MLRSVVALAIVFAAAVAAAQHLYRWTDEKGRVHVTDTPPPPGAKDVRRRSGGSAGEATETGQEPYALKLARTNNPVTLYSTPGSEACDEARKLLNARGVPFREVSVDSEKQLEELKKVVGSNSVPSLVIGSEVLKGFEEGSYHRALDAAGYPKAGVLPPRKQGEPPPRPETRAETKTETEEPAPGPYAPGAAPQRPRTK